MAGSRWKHYRNGKYYTLYTVASNPNTDVEIAVYGRPGGRAEYWRPLTEFYEKFEQGSNDYKNS